MKLLDLFSGGKSVARVAESLGYTVTTFDINKNYQPDIIANVLDFDYKSVWMPGDFDVVWASIPCETFSAARRSNIGRMVNGHILTTERLLSDCETLGVPLLRRTQKIIDVVLVRRISARTLTCVTLGRLFFARCCLPVSHRAGVSTRNEQTTFRRFDHVGSRTQKQ